MLMFTLPARVTLWTLQIQNMSRNLHLGGHIVCVIVFQNDLPLYDLMYVCNTDYIAPVIQLLWHSCQNQKLVKRRACLEIQKSLKSKHHLRLLFSSFVAQYVNYQLMVLLVSSKLTKSLFDLQENKEFEDKDEGPTEYISYWKPNVTINLVEDFTRYSQNQALFLSLIMFLSICCDIGT